MKTFRSFMLMVSLLLAINFLGLLTAPREIEEVSIDPPKQNIEKVVYNRPKVSEVKVYDTREINIVPTEEEQEAIEYESQPLEDAQIVQFDGGSDKEKIVINPSEKTQNEEVETEEEETTEEETVEYVTEPIPNSAKNGLTCDTTNLEFAGVYKITGYDACMSCCGKTDGITASGTQATVGRTVAMKGYPYGTRIYIEGYGIYTVEDTGGFKKNVIDIFCKDHPECYSITQNGVNVYILPD